MSANRSVRADAAAFCTKRGHNLSRLSRRQAKAESRSNENVSENTLWSENRFGRSAPVIGRSNVALQEILEKPRAIAHWTLLWPRTATLRTLVSQTGSDERLSLG